MRILMDPYVIIVPAVGSPTQTLMSYLEALQFWLGVPRRPVISLLYASNCVCGAIEADLFPYRHTLARALSTAGVEAYDPETLSRLASTLFESCIPVEDVFAGTARVHSISVCPSSYLQRLPKQISEAFADCLATLGLHMATDRDTWSDVSLGTVADAALGSADLSIRGTVTHIEQATPERQFPNQPVAVDTTLPALSTYERLVDRLEWSVVWEHPVLAVDKAYFGALPPGDRPVHPLGQYIVSRHFVDTIRHLSLHTQAGRVKSVYEACALVVCRRASNISGINPRAVRGQPRQSDGRKLMRANISGRGPGYRLHYWQGPSGVLELLSVNVHNDMPVY